MSITPNDPATCWHEDLETDVVERRLDGMRLVRVDVHIVCRDCETHVAHLAVCCNHGRYGRGCPGLGLELVDLSLGMRCMSCDEVIEYSETHVYRLVGDDVQEVWCATCALTNIADGRDE